MLVIVLFFISLFFFSSRRRHTRSLRDWSSDVCSSDLCYGSPQRVISRRHLSCPSIISLMPRSPSCGGWRDVNRFGTPIGRIFTSAPVITDRKSTRLNSSHVEISYAVFCLKKKKKITQKERNRLLDPVTPFFRPFGSVILL